VVERFRALGAQACSTLKNLGQVSDILLICVSNDAQLSEVVLGDNVLSGMRPGSVIVIHSTVHPHTVRAIAAEAAKVDVAVIDAPVSGGSIGARQGTLSILVGGDQKTFERCLPLLQEYGTPRLLGPLGSGQLCKLINSYVAVAQASMAYDAARLAEELGLDLTQFAEVLPRGAATSWMMDRYAWSQFTHLVPAHDKGRIFWADLASKDIGIIREILAEEKVEAPLVDAAVSRTIALMRGGGHLVFDDSVSPAEYAQRVQANLDGRQS
jgi:3-hydroxyisobutyrate dehydrogenase-like beta-hydroxyacid dehydrogenase